MDIYNVVKFNPSCDVKLKTQLLTDVDQKRLFSILQDDIFKHDDIYFFAFNTPCGGMTFVNLSKVANVEFCGMDESDGVEEFTRVWSEFNAPVNFELQDGSVVNIMGLEGTYYTSDGSFLIVQDVGSTLRTSLSH